MSRISNLLSPRQQQIVTLKLTGLENKQIANLLKISTRTVEHTLNDAYIKLNVKNSFELATNILRCLVPTDELLNCNIFRK